MDLSVFLLLQIISIGVYLGIRRKPLNLKTAFTTIFLLIMIHLFLGLYVSVRGVEAPRTKFDRGRSL